MDTDTGNIRLNCALNLTDSEKHKDIESKQRHTQTTDAGATTEFLTIHSFKTT